MQPTNLLCLACEFRVAMNKQFDMTSACQFNFSPPLTTYFMPLWCNSSLSLQTTRGMRLLIRCVWHVNFWWLSTKKRTWLQYVSLQYLNFFACFHYLFDFLLCNSSLSMLSYTKLMGPRGLTNWLSWACEFRITMNERWDIFTGCKFQYVQLFLPPFTYPLTYE